MPPRLSEAQRTQRNLNPHAEAQAAMYLWGADYARQRGGSMDFWDRLPDFKKRLCQQLVTDIFRARRKAGRAALERRDG